MIKILLTIILFFTSPYQYLKAEKITTNNTTKVFDSILTTNEDFKQKYKNGINNLDDGKNDILKEGLFVKTNGVVARAKYQKIVTMSKPSANIIYLQSISYISKDKWSITINNNSITSQDPRNVSDIVEIESVHQNHVKLKILYNFDKTKPIDKTIKVTTADDGTISHHLEMKINEFLDFSTMIVSHGNAITNYSVFKS